MNDGFDTNVLIAHEPGNNRVVFNEKSTSQKTKCFQSISNQVFALALRTPISARVPEFNGDFDNHTSAVASGSVASRR